MKPMEKKGEGGRVVSSANKIFQYFLFLNKYFDLYLWSLLHFMKGTKKRCYYIVIAWHVIIWIFIDDACTIALEGERSFFESCKNYSLMQGLPTKRLSTQRRHRWHCTYAKSAVHCTHRRKCYTVKNNPIRAGGSSAQSNRLYDMGKVTSWDGGEMISRLKQQHHLHDQHQHGSDKLKQKQCFGVVSRCGFGS